MFDNRCLRTAFVAVPMLCFVAVTKPPPEVPAEQTRLSAGLFWILKTHSPPQFDLVILGDSSGLNALSSRDIRRILPDYRTLNFAYQGGRLNPEIYRAAEAKFDPASRKKTILIAVSPRPLALAAMGNPKFAIEKARPREHIFEMRHPWFFWDLLKPVGWREMTILKSGDNDLQDSAYVEYHEDGWKAVSHHPNSNLLLAGYRRFFSEYKVSDSVVKAMVSQTRDWTSRGIRVFAVLCPKSEGIRALETELGGFDERAVRGAFEKAGGIWLVPRGQYQLVDGVHLDMRSAMRFSRDVAKLIKAHVAP